MKVGYNLNSIKDLDKHLNVSQLIKINLKLRKVMVRCRSKKSIRECIKQISEKLQIINELAEKLNNVENLTEPYVIQDEDFKEINLNMEIKKILKNTIKSSRNKKVIMNNIITLTKIFDKINKKLDDKSLKNGMIIEDDDASSENINEDDDAKIEEISDEDLSA